MDLIKIGKYIASKRKALGLTQVQLAEKLGKSDKSVSKWERGICLPDVSVYMELCQILGISLNEFIAGDCAAAGGIIVNIATAAGCGKVNASVDWYYDNMGLFGNSCADIPELDGSEGICYHTPSGNALPTFSS